MKQVIQYQKTGEMFVEELPAPTLQEGGVLVRNMFSLVSAGTERSSVETAKASMIGKARKRPDLVKQVKDNIKREGLKTTWEKVRTRLDNYAQLGYSSAGVVIESDVEDFSPGDRVACAGAGYASHAELIFVPRNLVSPIPDNVSFEQAAFTTLGSIALQGVRQAGPKLGEAVAVVGLGLLGLITVQLLKAQGCRVLGLDITENNFALAEKLGCDKCCKSTYTSLPTVESFTRGYGTDAVIITAATQSNEPVELALEMARKRSTVVVVGAVGMDIPRNPFYQKEIDFRISCSYGPGRYDSTYEEQGLDYPLGFVRWTENRNMQAVLDMMAMDRLDVFALISHTFPVGDALKAYDLITGKTPEPYLGILIRYPESETGQPAIIKTAEPKPGTTNVSFIGAGNFAQSYLIPHLAKCDVSLKGVLTANQVEAKSVAKKFGFEYCTSSLKEVTNQCDALFVATRHDSHARYVMEGLKADKHVYVEKPLAVTLDELKKIKETFKEKQSCLMVGFNRRYSEPFQHIRSFFEQVSEPLVLTYRVNAGFIPKEHWTQEPGQGGRIIGEGCHFIDCMSFLTQAQPLTVYAECISSTNTQVTNADNISVVIKFSDGSVGNLIYLANGDKSLGKEYCEVFGGGKIAIMNDFKSVRFFEDGKMRQKKYDGSKGHKQEVISFIETVQGKQTGIISFDSLVLTTLTTFKAMESLRSRKIEKITL